MMKVNKIMFSLLLFIIFGLGPMVLFAASTGLVPECLNAAGLPGPCGFSKLNALYENVSAFLLRDVLAPVAVMAIAFVGIQYLTALGNPGKLEKVHESAKNVLWGIVVALAAYGIIEVIFRILAATGKIPQIS